MNMDTNTTTGIFGGKDCDDEENFVFPGALREKEGNDLCYIDLDEDGFGDSNPPEGFDEGTDCD